MKGLVLALVLCTVVGIYSRPPLRTRNDRSEISFLKDREIQYKRARRLARVKILSPLPTGDRNQHGNTKHVADPSPELKDFEDIEGAAYNIGSEDENLVEGDIMLISHYDSDTQLQDVGSQTDGQAAAHNGQQGSLWTNKSIPWRVGSGQYSTRETEEVKIKVREALDEWTGRSCVTFPEIGDETPEGPFVEVINDEYGRCWSNIGQVNTGRQELALGDTNCFSHGVIMHEFAHAMGFGHEQSRPDRDGYIHVMTPNIDSTYLHNFEKDSYGTYDVSDSTPYDIGSVMHYRLQAFKSVPARTIVLKNPDLELLAGQRDTASWYDEVAVNKAYDCADGCEDNCQNGGYVRKTRGQCVCYCPPNIGGDNCEKVNTQCGETHLLASGETVTTVSQNYPQPYNHEECSYLYTAPAGNHLTLEFTDFNLPEYRGDCPHPLEIKSNLIGQDSHAYCGSLLPEIMSTASSVEKDKLLLVFYANDIDGLDTKPEGGFAFKVTAVPDQCVNDPCHGAPCSADSNGNYKCDFLENAFHCGFEAGLLGSCSRIVPNNYYDNKSNKGQAWSVHGTTEHFDDDDKEEETVAIEGSYFFGAENQWSEDSTERVGTMSIIPHKVGGEKWCLDFKYIVTGDTEGHLKVYKAVNGKKGDPIFTGQQTKSEDWTQIKLTVDGSGNQLEDMVEVVFEALHNSAFTEGEIIGIDDIKFTPGECFVEENKCDSYPCGTHQCIPTDDNRSYKCVHPSKDASCGFEDAEDDCSLLLEVNMLGDQMNFTYNTGSTPGYLQDRYFYPQYAHSGMQYVYLEASMGWTNHRAHMKILPFVGQRRKLSFWYYADGSRRQMGEMNLYRAINGEYPGELITNIFKGRQGAKWHKFEIVIDNSDLAPGETAELVIEAVHGRASEFSANRGDILIDDVSYTLINE